MADKEELLDKGQVLEDKEVLNNEEVLKMEEVLKNEEIFENQTEETEPKRCQEDPNYAPLPCDVEGNSGNVDNRCFPQTVRRKAGSNMHRPESDHKPINYVTSCEDDRKQTPLVFISGTYRPKKKGEEGMVFHYFTNNCYRYRRNKVALLLVTSPLTPVVKLFSTTNAFLGELRREGLFLVHVAGLSGRVESGLQEQGFDE